MGITKKLSSESTYGKGDGEKTNQAISGRDICKEEIAKRLVSISSGNIYRKRR